MEMNNMVQKSYDGNPALYLIPTPIGNMEDITLRAINTLKMVDYVLSEDTRVTSQLLKNLNISKKLVSCHEYNEDEIKDRILNDIISGKNIGLVTDRGTPIISDPGYKVVKYLTEHNVNVISLPGATAFVPSLTASGISPSPFIFYGFLNAKSNKRKEELEKLKNEKYTIIFYEAVHRIEKTLNDIKDIFGDRNISLNREISKVYEEIYRGTISEVLNDLDVIKGEFVIVVEGNKEEICYDDVDILEQVKIYMEDGIKEMDAIKKVAKERGVSKSEIYKEYHTRK
jgi:16S rRNA (cytidine1402-2'-O)-methyltransferase